MIKVQVSPVVVAGTDRGGEDLLLQFTCETENKAPWDKEFEVVLAEGEDLDFEVEGDLVSCETESYNFRWEGSLDDLHKLAQERFVVKKHWSFCHKPGETERLRLDFEYFVDGNAD